MSTFALASHAAADRHLNGSEGIGGNWGPANATVFDYAYNKTLNGTNYNVHCYCVEDWPCGCGPVNSTDYFDSIPFWKFHEDEDKKRNVTTMYINGTLDGEVVKEEVSSALRYTSDLYVVVLAVVASAIF